MRLIDADELIEQARRKQLDSRERIVQMIKDAPTVRVDCSQLSQGEIVYNANNFDYGIVISLFPDKDAVQILEIPAKGKAYVNCPPLTAISKTGERVNLKSLIKQEWNF